VAQDISKNIKYGSGDRELYSSTQDGAGFGNHSFSSKGGKLLMSIVNLPVRYFRWNQCLINLE